MRASLVVAAVLVGALVAASAQATPPKLYRFTAGKLIVFWTSDSKHPTINHFEIDSATGCGTTPLRAKWRTTQHASISNDVINHVNVFFTTFNPSQVYGASVPAGAVEVDLKLTTGKQPSLSLVLVPTGDVFTVIANPPRAPIKATPVKRCL